MEEPDIHYLGNNSTNYILICTNKNYQLFLFFYGFQIWETNVFYFIYNFFDIDLNFLLLCQ